MSFFDELTQKAKVVAATASEKAREAADSAKISASIIAEKRELDKNYRAIGQWYACEHLEGEVPEAIADVIAAVKASQEKITQLQAARSATASSAPTAARPWASKVHTSRGRTRLSAPSFRLRTAAVRGRGGGHFPSMIPSREEVFLCWTGARWAPGGISTRTTASSTCGTAVR